MNPNNSYVKEHVERHEKYKRDDLIEDINNMRIGGSY